MNEDSNSKSVLSILPGRKLFLRLDNWLRINQPLIWRTKVHYFVLFSFLLLNPLLWLIAYSYPLSLGSFPVVSRLGLLAFSAQMFGLLFFMYWTYRQTKIPVGEQSLIFFLKTLGIYMLCIFFLIINSLVFLSPVISNTADLVETDPEFEAVYNYHAENNFWNCTNTLKEDISEAELSKIKRQLLQYHIIEESDLLLVDDEVESLKCKSGSFSLTRKNGNRFFDDLSLEIQTQLKGLNEAKKFKNGQDHHFSHLFDWWYYLKVSFFLGLLATITIHPHYAFRRDWLPDFSRLSKYNPKFRYANFIKKLDNYILIHYPILWSTKVHLYLLHILIVCISLFILLSTLEISLGVLNALTKGAGGNFMLIIIFIIITSSFIIAGKWIYQQVRKKYIPAKFHTNLYLVFSYFILLALPPLSIALIFLYFDLLDKDLFYSIAFPTPIVCIPLISWIYSAKFMSNLRSLRYLLLSFGTVVGIFIFIILLSNSIESTNTIATLWALPSLIALILIIYFLRTNKVNLLTFFAVFYMSSTTILFILTTYKLGLFDYFFDLAVDNAENRAFHDIFIYLLLAIPSISILFIPGILALLKIRSLPKRV